MQCYFKRQMTTNQASKKAPLGNESKRDGPIASTEGLKLHLPQALVRKAAIPETAYDKLPRSLVTLLWKAQQGDALVNT